MTNVATGHRAEAVAAEHLKTLGFKIIEMNWKTPYCEIDIIARKKKRLYFVEVKYRVNDNQGTGFDYITAAKLKRMRFAAEVWVKAHRWERDYSLAAIELSGLDYVVSDFLENLSASL